MECMKNLRTKSSPIISPLLIKKAQNKEDCKKNPKQLNENWSDWKL